MFIPKTTRRKGIHRIPAATIPKVGKGGLIGGGSGSIKMPAFPKLPKLPKLPTTHTNKSKY